MVTYTINYKHCDCPMWGIKVSIRLKYTFFSDNSVGKLTKVTCPIIENSMKSEYKQDKKYRFQPFCKIEDCIYLKESSYPSTYG